MYSSRRGARVSRLKGINEFLSFEDETEGGGGEGGLGSESAPVASPKAADTSRTKAAGKRVLTEAEEVQYEKRTCRKLLVDPPAEKLMADAFKSVGGEEEQEPVAASHHDPIGPHSGGATFSEAFSSQCPLDPEEGGDESLIGDIEASPDISPFSELAPGVTPSSTGALPATSPSEGVKLPTGELVTDELANVNESQSPTSSALLPHSEAIIPSPTTSRMIIVDTTASSPGASAADDDEPLDYGSSSRNDDVDENESDGDDSAGWADPSPPSSDKASGYLPFYPTGSPTHGVADASSSLNPQAADIPPSESMPVTTSSLPEAPLSLKIPLKYVGTEIVLSSARTGALMALPSSPSHLDITMASPASSRSSPTVLPIDISDEVSKSSGHPFHSKSSYTTVGRYDEDSD
ncbi:DNA-directed RNA polymerase II subunit RPB1-like [Asparagus officinalis]|uniref:DNA-directed RNA polymerase II subunit RPB1-like n=1 Tax=Asparagus officinalis TaxID=4686 RepID=UPI00098E702D|nr:DNA-directed RNA polymerase II subunit RPB1-like [Asparagus officinalis]